MFDLLEEYVSANEQQGEERKEQKSARTSDSRTAALFSMPEKFISKRDSTEKKHHHLVPVLSVCIVALIIASVGLAFAIQNKNLQAAQERARQEAARVAALQAVQEQAVQEQPASDEIIPFQIDESADTAPTNVEAVPSSALANVEFATSSQSLIASANNGETSPSSTVSVSSATSTTTADTSQKVITFGQDTDKDKLSDVEERVYTTDPKKPDTDLDGVLDGAEVKNLYDPTKGGGAFLRDSGLVNVFTNQTYQYTFLYPNLPDEWAVGAIDQTQKEVMASAATGEYVSIRIEDNPKKLSIADWYAAIYAAGQPHASVQSMSFGQWNALVWEDGSVYYLAQKDAISETLTPYVYVLTHAPNVKKELHYSTTFQMLVKSFSPLEIVVTIEQ